MSSSKSDVVLTDDQREAQRKKERQEKNAKLRAFLAARPTDAPWLAPHKRIELFYDMWRNVCVDRDVGQSNDEFRALRESFKDMLDPFLLEQYSKVIIRHDQALYDINHQPGKMAWTKFFYKMGMLYGVERDVVAQKVFKRIKETDVAMFDKIKPQTVAKFRMELDEDLEKWVRKNSDTVAKLNQDIQDMESPGSPKIPTVKDFGWDDPDGRILAGVILLWQLSIPKGDEMSKVKKINLNEDFSTAISKARPDRYWGLATALGTNGDWHLNKKCEEFEGKPWHCEGPPWHQWCEYFVQLACDHGGSKYIIMTDVYKFRKSPLMEQFWDKAEQARDLKRAIKKRKLETAEAHDRMLELEAWLQQNPHLKRRYSSEAEWDGSSSSSEDEE